jgi:cytochrome c peroxidase
MKSIRFHPIAVLVAAYGLGVIAAHAQVPAGASMGITTAANQTGGSVTVNDPGNNVWVIQTSTDLLDWNQLSVWKVYNGSFHTGVSYLAGVPGVFYRAIFDPAQQNIPDTLNTALLLPETPLNYANVTLPPYYLAPPVTNQDNTPSTNPITDAGATLGRVLFFDKRLSTNQTIACASCHQPQHGFSDPRPVSTGFNGAAGTRNAMSLNNARFYQRGHFFWDERANTLEDQVLMPIQNPIEMGMTLPALLPRLAAEPFYTNLFVQAFGTPDVTTNRIALALAQFVRSIVSTNSKYDQGIPIGFSNFTPQENLGRQIFFGQVGNATCAICHATDSFSAANIFNNGLEFPYVDTGVGGITGRPQDMGLFKVPSLRNIELTAPYMHDGRFATLEQVVDFYNAGIVDNPNLSPPLRTGRPPQPPGGPLRLNLTTQQKAALVAFLKTLTDTSLTTDPRFADPFNYGN